jgi:hypothetical protein
MAVASYFAFLKFSNHENTGSFAKQYLHHYKTELDTNETMHYFCYINQVSNFQTGGRVNRNGDFYVDFTFSSLGVSEFTTSSFTIDLSFDLSFGVVVYIHG